MWLRLLKDISWVCFLALVMVFSRGSDWSAVRSNLRRNWFFGALLAAFIMTFAVMGWIHLFFQQTSSDTMLYWYRYPLEYIPIAFMVPMLVTQWNKFGKLALALGWISILFLAYEMFSGKEIGFFGVRYGSILGSPNDFGIFCALLVLGLLVFARTTWHWILALLMIVGLFLTVSRSAMVGLVAGVFMLLHLRRVRLAVAVGVVIAAVAFSLAIWSLPRLDRPPALVEHVVEHFDAVSLDDSALDRIDELHAFEERFGQLGVTSLLFGTNYFHVENWYMALLIRTGLLGLGLWLLAMAATLRRGWRLRRVSRVHAVAAAAVLAVAAASAFIPYPDVFPTNLYFWFAVGTVWLPGTVSIESCPMGGSLALRNGPPFSGAEGPDEGLKA